MEKIQHPNDPVGGPRISCIMLITFLCTALLLICYTLAEFYGNSVYDELITSTNQYTAAELATSQLKEASDMLTRDVRLFAVTGQTRFVESYFKEAQLSHTREHAVETIRDNIGESEALDSLSAALDVSNELKEREIYAIRLMITALNLQSEIFKKSIGSEGDDAVRDLYEPLWTIRLTDEDLALPSSEKAALAMDMLHEETYQDMDSRIDEHITTCLEKLHQRHMDTEARATHTLSGLIKQKITFSLIFIVLLLCGDYMIHRYLIRPLRDDVVLIRQFRTLPLQGAYELQFLARAYNKALLQSRQHSDALQHEAEHDPLTGLLNRGAFDKLRVLLREKNYALILLDVDLFKSVNDTYGHKVGDRVLKKVADSLCHYFRASDYPCRVGGDEFVVIVPDLPCDDHSKAILREKINLVSHDLTASGTRTVPAVTLSVGIAFSDPVEKNPRGEADIFAQADLALYEVKRRGRNGLAFYDQLSPPQPESAKATASHALEQFYGDPT